MALQTGENEQAMRKILDMTRLMSIIILFIHCYYYLYAAFELWQLTIPLTDRLLGNIRNTGLFNNFHNSKLIALAFLFISLLGAKGKKKEKLSYKIALRYLFTGLLLYFISYASLLLQISIVLKAIFYIGVTGLGFLLILSGGTLFTRIIKDNLADDPFNSENETFPQETRLIENEFSVNLPTRFRYKGKVHSGYLNCISPQRGVIVQGSAGSGKTAFFLRHVITQSLGKPEPFSALIYDFKFPDLSVIAYNHWLKNKHRYKAKSDCYFINFDDLSRTHRGNVFDPLGMTDITDASESARTILLGLNKEWQKKQGDFFVESGINFVTAVIWYLRKYQDGMYCTLPHVLELIQVEFDQLFSILSLESEISVLIGPFLSAYLNDVMEQLEGQIASAKIALARLTSPQLYYVLSGNDFSLDINNPEHPVVLCMGNNPQKIMTYGAVLSLYANRILKIINQKNKVKCALVFDEWPTLTVDLNTVVSTGRQNLICTYIGLQEVAQVRKEYGKESADVIINMVGNIISGQVSGDSAKQLSERIGKINQNRTSLSINSGDTSISKSKQLDYAVPASKISALSSGEFVGMVSDIPQQRMELKAFHCEIVNDFDSINKEEKAYKPIPIIRKVDNAMVQRNYIQIREDVQDLVSSEIERMNNDPALQHLVINKNK
ncbi:conjugal transfer protein MobC [Taibaiella chishuiensis]|uniref:Type IV secretory system conjugative DNA transfer VirD4/TraG family protein n=1 Tax=Taibaiella chishuiensis TaxID=1434707 RepID=A0A2P8D0W8_9BACT|nr:conjugal transfer protein MobC [Taibaiella chishuiensis]PSK90860.1 type IV secretory system conjugative DNA transfer VirD4/TraG family protein [Taibaiella chishuiensis]